jgi:pilus assembly protein CpaC
MQSYVSRSARAATIMSVLGLMFIGTVGLIAQPVLANSDAMAGRYQSVITIGSHERLPQTRDIKLARNKAMIIDLPRDLRDVMVSAPDIVDAVVQSANRVHLIGKKTGQSNIFFFDDTGEQILTLEVSVERDTRILDSLLKRLIPGANIKSEILNSTIVLTGSVRNPADSTRADQLAARFAVPDGEAGGAAPDQVINLLAVEGEEQVMLRVVVAEVQRSILKQFGVNVGASINSGSFSTSILTDNALPLTAGLGLGTLPQVGIGTVAAAAGAAIGCATSGVVCNYNPGPSGSSFGNSGTSSFAQVGNSTITQAVRALERTGLLRTLAEPNLTAISGESAKFLAGGEYPVPIVDTNGGLSVSFKEFGVGVAFTPTVLSEGRISLKIDTEVSELTNSGSVVLSNISIPALKKRQANSTIELPSGGSLAMAGLISEDVRQNIDGFPGLKDLPILGSLFRSTDFVRNETELVVIVTPYVIRPTARQNLARPTDGLAAPSDLKSMFLGHLNRIYGKGKTMPAGGLKGDYGFIVE